MSEKKNLSVEEILAAARAADGGGGGAPKADSGASSDSSESAAPAESAASEAAPAKKSAGEMSVAEMLAAARAEKSGGGKPAEEKPKAEPASPAAAPDKKPGEMSVAEMLAAARAEKAGPAKPAAPAKPKATPKPAAKAEAAAPAAKPAPSGPKDTASILAAARKADKPGPMTKAEAAAKSEAASGKAAKKQIEVPPMPEKPAYAIPARPAAAETTTRRSFFSAFGEVLVGSSLGIGFIALAVTNLLWVLGFARYMFPNILTEPPTKFKVGFPDDFAPGQVETKFKAQFGIWLVRYEYEGQPQIYALKAVCTHLGCTPNWLEGEQKFKCPCHGSGFYKDGVNFEGPAPRPLERYAISLADDGQLEVDKSRKFQEEMGQWKDSASYVPV